MLLACSLPAFAQTSGITDVIPIGGEWLSIFRPKQPFDNLQAACEFQFNFSNTDLTPIPACRIRRLGRNAYIASNQENGFGFCYTGTPNTELKIIDGKYTLVCGSEFIEDSYILISHKSATCPAPANGQRAAATDCTCPVEPLKPITDPEALRFENGDNVREDKLSPSMKTKLQCLKNAGVGFKLTSAWRPQSYQDHLYEIYTKLIKFDKLAENKQLPMVCNSLRTSIDKHAGAHGVANMLPSGKRKTVAKISNHRLGNAFDGKWSASNAKLDAAAKGCGLWRSLKFKNDPPHFESL